MRKLLLWCFLPALALAVISIGSQSGLWAQEANDTPPGEEKLVPSTEGAMEPEKEAPVLDRGDNAWMLVSSALVLFMTVPGLAMFYGGLVRKKNVNSVIMQCLFLMGLMTVIWGTVGYSLAFGGSGPWIGNDSFLFMKGVQATWAEGTSGAPGAVEYPMHPDLHIPLLTHMLFQGMFFIITPALICGAFAERMKFSSMVVFTVVWGLLVYCPLCHWVWGGGILAYNTPHGKEFCAGGALDFAGGTVVHISSGVSALICALVLGKRIGYPSEPMPPHNLTYTALGAGMLWVGWFGFNAGSALAADGLAASAFCATHFSAAAGAMAWPLVEWLHRGKPTLLGASSGAVAGLVCITPAAGHVTPMAAILMGAVAGTMCSFTCSWLKPKCGYDDSLDAFGVHGLGGTLGAADRRLRHPGRQRRGQHAQSARLARGGQRAGGSDYRHGHYLDLRSRGIGGDPENHRCDDGTSGHSRGRNARPRRQSTWRRGLHLHLMSRPIRSGFR